MDIETRLDTLMRTVSRKTVSEIFASAMCKEKRERQRYGAEDHRTRADIIADVLREVFRAGAAAAFRMCQATEDDLK